MNEMIERVAVALYAADGFALAIYSPEESWPRDRENVRRRYREKARVVITAMREPTDSMTDAGMNVGSFPMCNGEVVVRWHAMIDSVLSSE